MLKIHFEIISLSFSSHLFFAVSSNNSVTLDRKSIGENTEEKKNWLGGKLVYCAMILNWKCFPFKIFVQYLFQHVGHVRDVWTNVRQRRGWQLSAADKDWGFVSPSAGGAVADPDLHVRPVIHAQHQEHRGTVSQQSILKLSDKSSLKQY